MTEDDDSGSPDGAVSLYEQATDEDGIAVGYEHLEPDPDRWALVLEHERFHDSFTTFDAVMADYDREVELHVGPDCFEEVHRESERLPSELNVYIAAERSAFVDEVPNRLFRALSTDKFLVPDNGVIGLAFGSYRDVIDVPEGFDYLDVKVPTNLAHQRRRLEMAFES